MTSKQTLIEQIRELNPTATPGQLLMFPQHELVAYHERLTRLADHRGSETRWSRKRPRSISPLRRAA